MDKSGYLLWEVFILLFQFLVIFGVLVFRRKAKGRPAFTIQDRWLLFGDSQRKPVRPVFLLKFCVVIVLCSFVGLLVNIILAPLGAGVLTTAQLLTYMGIVNRWLC